MSNRVVVQATASGTNVPKGGILQRKCASCGQHTVAGGSCSECEKKKGSLQRKPSSSEAVSEVPPIVHEVLRSPGQPLDANTRAFMEPRLGHDFSGVRVHTDARAEESARAVHAQAFTVGRNMVFAAGRYSPNPVEGQKLLAHELAHVVQQGAAESYSSLEIAHVDSASEVEAEAAARRALNADQRTGTPPSHTPVQISRQEDQPESQEADTKGPAPSACVPKFISMEAVNSCSILIRVGKNGCELSFGSPDTPGITFRSKVEVPEGCYGELGYVQHVDSRRELKLNRRNPVTGKDEIVTRCAKITNALDKKDPLRTRLARPGPFEFIDYDSPGASVEGVFYQSDEDKFTRWLKWQTTDALGVPLSPWEPLAVVQWYWKAKANKTAETGNCAADWTISDDYASGGIGVEFHDDIPPATGVAQDMPYFDGPC
ncbi:MAG: DUF4157 domain-containing protein [Acidobacteriota bacterium]